MSKLVYGVGFNSKGRYKTRKGGRLTKAYSSWRPMMQRCYDARAQISRPWHTDCVVSNDWHDFQDFAEWYDNHPYSDLGYELDKDLLFNGNKVYSPQTCCLIPHELNVLLLDRRLDRGVYPQGVDRKKSELKYRARLNVDGKSVYLGCFDCPSEAHQVYRAAKERYVKNKALEWANKIEWNVFVALMSWTLES